MREAHRAASNRVGSGPTIGRFVSDLAGQRGMSSTREGWTRRSRRDEAADDPKDFPTPRPREGTRARERSEVFDVSARTCEDPSRPEETLDGRAPGARGGDAQPDLPGGVEERGAPGFEPGGRRAHD